MPSSLLAALRAELRPQPPQLAQPAPQGPQAGGMPCPFGFGPWQPRTGPQAVPGEAQRSVHHGAAHVGWLRRAWCPWVSLPGEEAPHPLCGSGVPTFQLLTPAGALVSAALSPQPLLEELALRLGAGAHPVTPQP